jgi:hypothetical protein
MMKKNLNKIFFVLLVLIAGSAYSQKLYFCEEYKDSKEVGLSETFIITSAGGYFTCMLDLRDIGKTVGTEKVQLVIVDRSYGGYKKIATEKFDVQSDWDYIYFDKFHTFYKEGYYQVTAEKSDGKKIASGFVTVKMK